MTRQDTGKVFLKNTQQKGTIAATFSAKTNNNGYVCLAIDGTDSIDDNAGAIIPSHNLWLTSAGKRARNAHK